MKHRAYSWARRCLMFVLCLNAMKHSWNNIISHFIVQKIVAECLILLVYEYSLRQRSASLSNA